MRERAGLQFILAGVVLVAAILFGSYVVLTKFRPEREIARMLVAMSEVTTAKERAAFSWTRGQDQDRVTTSLYTLGQVDLSDPGRVSHDTKFRLFRISKAGQYADLSGEIRALDGMTYLTYASPGPEIEGVDFGASGTWVSFAEGELPAWGAVIPGLDDPLGEDGAGTLGASGWTGEGLMRLRSLLRRADVFLVSYDDLTELIDGHATRVIDARFDPDAIRSFLRDVIRARENREPTSEERLAVEVRAKALERLTLRLWISMDDHRLYRFQASGAVPDATDESELLIPTDAIVEFSNFDEPFSAEPPSSPISFQSIIGLVFGTEESALFLGPDANEPVLLPNDSARLPTASSDRSDDPDQDGLSDVVEAFYRTDPNNPDTDGDGVSDGEEVLNGRNPRGEGTLFGFGLDE